MESKRAFMEAYISARYPQSHVCGLMLPTQYLLELYPYDEVGEIDYLLDLLSMPINRALFERVVLPEMRLFTQQEQQPDAFERGEAFSIALVSAALRRDLPAVVTWLTDFDTVAGKCDLIHDALGMMYELMSAMYSQPDLAFTMWFPDAETYASASMEAAGLQPVHAFVDQYLFFLSEAAKVKNHPVWQNKNTIDAVMSDMDAKRRVNA